MDIKVNKTPNQYKTIIFDFDGTIADTFGVFYNILRELGPQIGIGDITPEDILAYRQKGAKELIKQFKIKAWRVPFLIKKGQKIFGKHIESTAPFERMPEVLRLLFESKIKLGIVTTNTSGNVRKFLEKWDLEVFDFVISTPSLFGKKSALKRTLKRYGLKKEEVIYIGDEVRDIESAKSAGISVGAVVWGYNTKDLLVEHSPDFVFEEPKNLLELRN